MPYCNNIFVFTERVFSTGATIYMEFSRDAVVNFDLPSARNPTEKNPDPHEMFRPSSSPRLGPQFVWW